jgi:hypothetical protein
LEGVEVYIWCLALFIYLDIGRDSRLESWKKHLSSFKNALLESIEGAKYVL